MNKLRMSWPNRITLGRILLIVPFTIALLHMNDAAYRPWARYAALVIFVTVAVSDALDGWLARRNNCVTALGTYLDPLADKLLIMCACILLSARATAVPGAELPDVVVVMVISKDLYTILGFVIIYLVTNEMRLVTVTAGKVTTALQLCMVVGTLFWPDAKEFWPGFSHVVRVLWWSSAMMAALTIIIYTRNGTRYLNAYEQQQRLRKQQEQERGEREHATGE